MLFRVPKTLEFAVSMNLRLGYFPHPGEMLAGWIEGKRLAVAETASLLRVSTKELHSILSGEAPLPPALAVRLEQMGWSNAESWSGTQALWDIAQARKEIDLPAGEDGIGLSHRTRDLGFDVHLRVPGRAGPAYRPRCASICIASPGPDEPDQRETRFGRIRSRSGARLEHTQRDAQGVHTLWRNAEPDVPEELCRLLIDPTVREVERVLRDVSAKILGASPIDIGLDLFFAGHGEKGTGNLVLKDGTLSPCRLLELQVGDMHHRRGGQRTLGVWLDSCYSGAFLLRLALEAFEENFRFDEGLASCLPDEMCFEMDTLEHGVFTYTRLYPGNAHVERERFNQAILENNPDDLAKGLQGLVGLTSSPSAFLTEGKQFSMSLTKHVICVDGGFATLELRDTNDLADVTAQLTNFRNSPVLRERSTA